MKTGMMWQQLDPKHDLADEIKAAAAYYAKKYGRAPNACQVHPSRINGTEKVKTETGEIALSTNRSVMPNLLWLGEEVEHTGGKQEE